MRGMHRPGCLAVGAAVSLSAPLPQCVAGDDADYGRLLSTASASPAAREVTLTRGAEAVPSWQSGETDGVGRGDEPAMPGWPPMGATRHTHRAAGADVRRYRVFLVAPALWRNRHRAASLGRRDSHR